MAGTVKEIWEAALGELQLQVSPVNYATWLKDTTGIMYEDDLFVVGAPTAFATEWLEKRLHSLVRKSLIGILGHSVHVRFVVHQPPKEQQDPESPLSSGERWPRQEPFAGDTAAPKASAIPPLHTRLNPRYTFASFVVGNSNRLAHAAALSVAEHPGTSYNPLFIYGGVGLGKTHLLHAICHETLWRNHKALYVSSEQFTNEFINAIRERKNEEFRAKYRSVALLLIDDIHFIAGKEQTQEEFFHTFNDLHGVGRQIILTSDRPPKSMPLLEDRLASRFVGGLITDIQPPDFETRVAILRTKSEGHRTTIPAAVLEFIAQKVQSNIRELEGTLNRVIAFARLSQAEISTEVAARALEDLEIGQGRRRSLPAAQVVSLVATFYGISEGEMRGKRRDKDTARARQVAMFLLREETNLSLKEIGRELGGRDHSTVLHGHEKIAQEVDISNQLRRDVLELREQLYAKKG